MSKFNTKVSTAPKATSYEGGAVYEKNIIEDWINNLFSSFLENRYYESSDDQMKRYMQLTNQVAEQLGWEFIAKASMFARNELGLRSIAQLTAAMLNGQKFDSKRAYFRNFCHRPDDVSEIFAAVDVINGKRSHALVRGTADYLSTLNDYTLGKYKLNGKTYNMYDLINITHANSETINKYKNDTLEIPDTWETAISTAGDQKEQEWMRLVEEKKLGYLALIRNLRNILNADSLISNEWIVKNLVPQLTNEVAIRKSLVYPYQIYCAAKNMTYKNPAVMLALDTAFRISVQNMPELPGSTAIILDISGSMDSLMSEHSNMRIKEVGAVYAAAIYVSNPNADFIKFGTDAKYCSINRLYSIFDIIEQMQSEDNLGYGTDIHKAFNLLDKSYDRIFVISDMQTMSNERHFWYSGDNGIDSYKKYCKKYGKSKCYSFDLGNYRTQTANPNDKDVYLLTALNDKIFDFIKLAEKNTNIVDYIEENYDYR